MCIFQRRQFSAVFFVSVPRRSRTFSPATHTMKPKEHNANGGENMEGLLWLLILCTLTAGALAILGICRRMQEHTLPERIVTWVALSEQAQLQAQLEALAAQVLWADCALLKTVWLVDTGKASAAGFAGILPDTPRISLLPHGGASANLGGNCSGAKIRIAFRRKNVYNRERLRKKRGNAVG